MAQAAPPPQGNADYFHHNWMNRYPDAYNDAGSGVITTRDMGALAHVFGEPRVRFNPGDQKPVTNTFMNEAFAGDTPEATRIFHRKLETENSWEFMICPRQFMPFMSITTVETIPQHIMEIAPELSSPPLIRSFSERTQVTLQRHALGFAMTNDFFMRPDGQAMFREKMLTLVSAAFLRAKMIITSHLATRKNHYKFKNAQNTRYRSLGQATVDKRRFFGAASTNAKWLYELKAYVDAVMGTESIVPDMGVGPDGWLMRAAINEFETEAYRRGGDVTEDRLINSGFSIKNIFAGKDSHNKMQFFESRKFNIINFQQDNVELFLRQIMVSQWWLQKGASPPDPTQNYSVERELSISFPGENGYCEITPQDLENANMRWEEDGSLARAHEDLVDPEQLNDFLRRSGFKVSNGLLDPYAYETSDGRYRLINVWGDAHPSFLSVKILGNTGKRIAHMIREQLDTEDLARIRRLKDYADSLNSPSVSVGLAVLQFISKAKSPLVDGIMTLPAFDGNGTPYGYGNIAGLRRLFADGQGGPVVSEGLPALLRYYELQKLVHCPSDRQGRCLNALFDPAMCPTFLKSGNEYDDSLNAAITSTWRPVEYPVFLRNVSSDTLQATIRNKIVGTSFSAYADMLSKFAAVAPSTLRSMVESAQALQSLADVLAQDNPPLRLVQGIATGSFLTEQGRALLANDRKNVLIAILATISSLTALQQKRVLFQFLSRVRTQIGGPLTREERDRWANTASDMDVEAPAVSFKPSQFTLSGTFWRALAKTGVDSSVFADIRPANPTNPNLPFGGTSEIGVADVASQARTEKSADWGQTVFAHPELIMPAGAARGAPRSTESLNIGALWPAGSQPHASGADLLLNGPSHWLVDRLRELDQEMDWSARVSAQLMCFSIVHRNSVMNYLNKNVAPPFSTHMVYQRGVRLETAAMLFAKSGSGKSGIVGGNITKQLDGANKRWLVHAHAWFGANLPNAASIMIVPDIFFRQLLGGASDSMFTSRAQLDELARLRPGEPDRLPDLLSFCMGGTVKDKDIATPFNLSGRRNKMHNQYPLLDPQAVFDQHTNFGPPIYYQMIGQFYKRASQGTADYTTYASENASTSYDDGAYRGTQRYYNHTTGEFSIVRKGNSHLADVPAEYFSDVLNGRKTMYAGLRVDAKITC